MFFLTNKIKRGKKNFLCQTPTYTNTHDTSETNINNNNCKCFFVCGKKLGKKIQNTRFPITPYHDFLGRDRPSHHVDGQGNSLFIHSKVNDEKKGEK